MSVSVSITLSLDDFIAANLLYQRRYWIWRGLLKVFALTVPSYFLLMLGVTTFTEPALERYVFEWLLQISLCVGVGMTLFIPLASLLGMRLAVKRQFEQLSLGLPAEYEIDAKGLRAVNEQGTATLTWDRFSDFVQDRRLLLLKRTRRVFFILPKAQLSGEELQATLTYLREAGVKEG